MKTAISVPYPLFKKAEVRARRLGWSRSRLYAAALEAFLRASEEDRLTERINAALAGKDTSLDPVFEGLQAETMKGVEWK